MKAEVENGGKVEHAECMICAYPIDSIERLRTVTVCRHVENICSICYLRVRALQRNFHCPTCKTELDHVIVTNESKQFTDFQIWGESIGEAYTYDQRSQMFFPKDYFRSKVQKLWQLKCTLCSQTRNDFKGLRGHLAGDHNMHLCMLCVDHKQVFPSEQKVYTKADYDKHVRFGDGDGSIGHPNCEFCKTRFYDSTALFLHLTKEHYTCFLCEQRGIRFKYYHTYEHLQTHFRKGHYLCEEASCLERRFVAFHNEIDLRSHTMAYHPHIQVKRTIPLQFTIRRGPEVTTPNTSATNNTSNRSAGAEEGKESTAGGEAEGSGRKYEGGLGGRAQLGEWQVEVMPPASDPRDPNRNIYTSAPATTEEVPEEFPALPPSMGLATGLVNNRWVSSTTTTSTSSKSTGSSKGTTSATAPKRSYANPTSTSAEHFPSLPAGSGKKASAGKKASGAVAGGGGDGSKKYTQVLEIQREYMSLGPAATPAPAPTASTVSLAAYLKPSTKKKSAAPAAASAPPPPPVDLVADDYEEQLGRALQESMRDFKNPPHPPAVDDLAAFPPPPPPPGLGAVAAADSQVGVRAGVKTEKKPASAKKKPVAVSEDWSAALKAVGMSLPPKKKAGSKLKVIKAADPAADAKLAVKKT
eukprot:gene32881-39762_t